jgi:ABC-type nitrate/sulfonate/bicarbonate transport system substrate-binding protein
MRRRGFGAVLPFLATLLGLAALTAACAAPAPPAAAPTAPDAAGSAAPAWTPVRLTVPYSPSAGSTAPFWIAVAERVFEREGLEVVPEGVGGSSAIIQAMVGGQYEIGVVGGGDVAASRLAGSDLVLIASHVSTFTIEPIVKPEIRTAADLRGKVVTMSRLGTSTHFAAIMVLASAGLKPDDVTFIQSGGTGETLAVMLSGRADLGMMGYPTNLQAKRAGYRQLLNLSELGEHSLFPQNAVAVRESWLREPRNREIALRFVRALDAGLRLAKTDAAATKRVLREYTRVDDEADLQATFEFYRAFFPATLRVEARSIQNALGFLEQPGARDADPRLFFDNSLVEALAAGAAPRGGS